MPAELRSRQWVSGSGLLAATRMPRPPSSMALSRPVLRSQLLPSFSASEQAQTMCSAAYLLACQTNRFVTDPAVLRDVSPLELALDLGSASAFPLFLRRAPPSFS